MLKHGFKLCALSAVIALAFSGCANFTLGTAKTQVDFNQEFLKPDCANENYLQAQMEQVNKDNDPIFVAINAGSIARSCGDFNKSNEFFDLAESKYKYDVDLESIGKKGAKLATSLVLSDTFNDYDGNMYERIMVNVYKGFNFMSLGDYENARVEFNRAALRQEVAKEYFKQEIAKEKKEQEKAKKDPNYTKEVQNGIEEIKSEYEHLFDGYNVAKEFTNPYASYAQAVFSFMDKDYAKAIDKFKEISAINKKAVPFEKNFSKAANSVKGGKNYIFLAFEDGLGSKKDEFKLTIPLPINDKITATSLTFPKIVKRDASLKTLSLNGVKSFEIANFDDIFATEFKIELPGIILKSVMSSVAKGAVAGAVANNTSGIGGDLVSLGVGVLLSAINKTDTRSWLTLPKTASIAMVENKGSYSIKDSSGKEIAKGKVKKGKNALIWVRSVAGAEPQVVVIEK